MYLYVQKVLSNLTVLIINYYMYYMYMYVNKGQGLAPNTQKVDCNIPQMYMYCMRGYKTVLDFLNVFTLNYDYIITNSINSLLIISTCIPIGADNLAHASKHIKKSDMQWCGNSQSCRTFPINVV